METMRRYVLPLLWVVIAAVIAASLAKMAFFSDSPGTGASGEEAPAASLSAATTVPVTRADVASTLSLPGTVRADPGRPVPATTTGEVVVVWVKNGEHVSKGSRVLQVKVPRETDPVPAPAPPLPSGAATAPSAAAPLPAPAPQQFTYHTLYAPGSGTISVRS